MSLKVTRGIEVQVDPAYHPEASRPEQKHWFFSYTVTITNRSGAPVQLLSRHWVITNAHGDVEHVRGPGVVGEQPRLAPGASFQYTSYCPLDTSLGSMHGTFQMQDERGQTFDAEIAPFTLADPDDLN